MSTKNQYKFSKKTTLSFVCAHVAFQMIVPCEASSAYIAGERANSEVKSTML